MMISMIYKQAQAMMQESAASSSTAGGAVSGRVSSGFDEDLDDEEALMQRALELSMNDNMPSMGSSSVSASTGPDVAASTFAISNGD